MARRTLPHPPSDRYAHTGGEVTPHGGPDPSSELAAAAAGGWRAEAGAVGVATGTAILLVLVGGVLGLTTGLLFVAGAGGAMTGLILAGSPRARSRLRVAALSLAVGAVVVGAVGGWLIALGEGGALGLLDYVWAMTGVLVPVEALVAALGALWGVSVGPIRG
jgi:hypothetical protein